jgi:hypothetical protein
MRLGSQGDEDHTEKKYNCEKEKWRSVITLRIKTAVMYVEPAFDDESSGIAIILFL